MAQTNAKNELTLEIDALSYGPYGIGRLDGKAVMVPNTAPGDIVAARIIDSKARYAVGEVVHLVRPSPLRQPPPCPYAGECGGCSWQHLRYDAQLRAKQQSVADALLRIGKLTDFEHRPIIASTREHHYRRRIRLQCDNAKRAGYFRALSHTLVEIDSCLIAEEAAERCLSMVRRWFTKLATPIQYIEIVVGDLPGEVVIVASSPEEFRVADEGICAGLIADVPSLSGLILSGPKWRRTWGQSAISLQTEPGLNFNVESDVFLQVNRDGNQQMLKELLAAGEFTGDDRVLELYCGAGNFTLSVAKRAREVVAIEGSRRCVESGKRSADLNGLRNIRWIDSAVPSAVERLRKSRERFSKVVLDPPRAGAKAMERNLAGLAAEKILYISCNPATLARDLSALVTHGYRLRMVQPIDFFPYTFHVEALAVLTR
jgi:23S rRNA (uracil1939-C5)-methyltransferase